MKHTLICKTFFYIYVCCLGNIWDGDTDALRLRRMKAVDGALWRLKPGTAEVLTTVFNLFSFGTCSCDL